MFIPNSLAKISILFEKRNALTLFSFHLGQRISKCILSFQEKNSLLNFRKHFELQSLRVLLLLKRLNAKASKSL